VDQVRQLIADPDTQITRGSTYDNRANLAKAFFDVIIRRYEGTRLGRQEIEAELLEDVPGALWTRGIIEATRGNTLEAIPPGGLIRIVVAVDPAVTSNEDSDETGIVVAALTRGQHVLILDDLSCRESPLGWAKVAIAAYRARHADRIVAEVNNGGDLVIGNIRAIDPSASVRAVRASRGKYIRAEPVAALYEQGRVHHIGTFPALEDQMCGWTPQSGEKSPDRLDALVWAVTELLIDIDDTPIGLSPKESFQISSI
jgi:phage terminase large subunit-like protein